LKASGDSTNKVFQKSSDIACKPKTSSLVSNRSGCHPVSVPWIQGGLSDIGEPQHLCRQPLQPDSEAAVGRHTEIEHFEMALKTMRVDAPSRQGFLEPLPEVQTLTACSYLDASKQQVKALGSSLTARRCIEWPACQGESDHKYGRDPCFPLGQRAKLPLILG